ncbi:MAG: hypothetical protein ACC630_04685 [Nitrospinota bacterium]
MFRDCKRVEELERIYRKETRDRLAKDITSKNEDMIKNGLFPFEGRWLTIDDIKRYKKKLKKKDRGIFYELIFLFLLMGFLTLGLYKVLISLLPK